MDTMHLARLDRELSHLEHRFCRAGQGRAGGRQLRRFLGFLHSRLLREPGNFRLDDSMHRALHQLIKRTETTRTPQDVRNLIRDIRQYQLTVATLNKSWSVENRLHELEQQVKASEAPVEEEPILDADVITLESLAGKRMLFAIMPFSPDFQDVWMGGIKRAASGTGLTPVRIDMITQSSEITDEIVKVIRASEIVVVDVTGDNPNVMFEFGFALAVRKKLVVISQSTDYLTFDIKNLRTLIYRNTWQGIENLHKELQPFIKGAIGKRAKSKKKVKEPSKKRQPLGLQRAE